MNDTAMTGAFGGGSSLTGIPDTLRSGRIVAVLRAPSAEHFLAATDVLINRGNPRHRGDTHDPGRRGRAAVDRRFCTSWRGRGRRIGHVCLPGRDGDGCRYPVSRLSRDATRCALPPDARLECRRTRSHSHLHPTQIRPWHRCRLEIRGVDNRVQPGAFGQSVGEHPQLTGGAGNLTD